MAVEAQDADRGGAITVTFTRRYLDPAWHVEYKALCVFEDKLCIWDKGPTSTDGQVLYTQDGTIWSTLFHRPATEIGAITNKDGNGMAVYNGSLFITKYISGAWPRVIEWDGSDVHLHLEAPVQDNYMASNLVVWNNRLWVLLDVTPFIANNRRVVHYYDGAAWTAITDYDGAAYLNYNRGVSLPEYHIKHRTTRLFVFGDELYLIATRYTGAKWAWEVWKFDVDAYDNFTKVYDSDVFDDGYALAAIIEFEDKIKIVGNQLAANGNPGLDGKIYTSTDMENWTLEATHAAMGFPYGELIFEGKFYLNCVNVFPNNKYTWIRHWEGRLGEFTLDQEITTNARTKGGGLAVFNGDIYAGKYKEVYGEPGFTRMPIRLRGRGGSADGSMPVICMNYKDQAGNIYTKYMAPIDVRAPTRFYDGRIKQMSSLKRAIDDKTGLFQVADMSITLANTDKEFSRLLAKYIFKNQLMKLYHLWTDEPEAMRPEIISMICEDHSMKGPDFIIKFKDITQKYFTKKVPENICTKDDYPNISDEHIGWCKPEILGNAYLPWGTPPPFGNNGAVEAIYVNTYMGWFIAANGTLQNITDVFVDDVRQTEGLGFDYTWGIYDENTYIFFTGGSKPAIDSRVTFNAHGYSVPIWDSANGYVQNLAYIIQYYLRFLMDIPASLVNAVSFQTLAGYYEDMGVAENGYLILRDRTDGMEILRQLLFTGGAKGFMAMDGKFNVQRKNICNWGIASTDYHIFEQTDLFDSPDRQWNLTSAINTVNVEFGLIPWQRLYTGAKSEYKDNRYERPMEDDIRIDKRMRE